MKTRYLSLVLCFFLALSTIQLLAQKKSNPMEKTDNRSPYFFGLSAGVNQAMHNAQISTFAQDEFCPKFGNSSNWGYFVGGYIYIPFGNLADSKHSLYVKGTYSTLPADFVQAGSTHQTLVYTSGSEDAEIIDFSTEHTLSVTYNVFSVEALYKYLIVDNIGFAVGPTFDFPVSKTSVQELSLIRPDNVQFEKGDNPTYVYSDDLRTIYINNGDLPDSQSFRFGLKFGLMYEWVTGAGFDLTPFAFYNLALTKVTSAEDWRVNAFQIGCDIRFKIML